MATLVENAASFVVHEAGDSDSQELLDLVTTPRVGRGVRWSIERSPDFFLALRAETDGWRAFVARDERSGSAIGCLSVATRRVYLAGQARPTCYITNLHVAPEWRGRGVADRLCWHAHELIQGVDGRRTPTLLVVRANNRSMRTRASGPRGLPDFRWIGRLAVHRIPTRRLRRLSVPDGIDVDQAQASDLAELAALSNRVFQSRDFAPHFDAASLARWIAGAPGLELSDFLVAREGGRIVGWLGLWDEAVFRRARVASYTRLAAARYAVRDALRPLTGWRPAPKVGELVGSVVATQVCVAADRPDVLRALLAARGQRLYASGCSWLKIALDVRDPLAGALPGLGARVTPLLACVTTPAGARAAPELGGRALHFDTMLA